MSVFDDILAVVIAFSMIGYGVVVHFAYGMSDNPSDKVPVFSGCIVPLAGAALMIGLIPLIFG